MMPPCSLCTRVGGGGYGGVTALRMVLELGVSWVSALVTGNDGRERAKGRRGRVALDAQAEVYVLLVAGVGVEVVGGAAVELVALAEFAAYEEAEGYGSESGGDPAEGLEDGGLFVLVLVGGHGGGFGFDGDDLVGVDFLAE